MSDGGRSIRSYHSPAPQRHSSHLDPPSHQSSPQRQVRFGDQQEYLQPEPEQDDDDEMEQEQADDELVGEILIEDRTELRVKVVMAISAMRGKVGMCLYTQSDNKLQFIEDQQDSHNWDLVQLSKPTSLRSDSINPLGADLSPSYSVLDQTKPDKIYTSSGADVPFTEVLDQEMTRLHPDSNFAVNGTLVEHVSKKEFLSAKGRQMLQNVEIREGGVYESSWSREGSQQIDQLGDDEVAEASSSTERAAKRARRGAGPARASGNATLIGDQQRRNANLRIEAFLASIESSSITVSILTRRYKHAELELIDWLLAFSWAVRGSCWPT
jgi:DNA mismatch repair protein MSH5